MSATPPDDEERRPPIHSLDEPLDDEGAEEVERKREERRSQAELPVAAVEAMKMKGLGFSIMPLPTNAKAPPPPDWEKATVNNPTVFLQNPGTHNYAVLPPPDCFGWDVDKDVPDLLRKLTGTIGIKLPPTLMTVTPNGRHLFYEWPLKDRPRGPMFGGIVTRWPLGEGQGYLVGPGSVVVQENGALGVYQAVGLDDPSPIAELPLSWAVAALQWRPAREVASVGPLAEVRPHYELPESVGEGLRYESIRTYTAHLYNRGWTKDEMWLGVQGQLAPRFIEPLTLRELKDRFERAVRDIEDRLGEPKALPDFSFGSAAPVAPGVGATGAEHSSPSQEGLVPPLFVDSWVFADELRARGPIAYLVPGWVPAAGLTVWAGHPKSMKSLAVLQMLGAFVAGEDWLGTSTASEDVRVGLYLTREGSHAEMLKRVDALTARHGAALGTRLRFAYEQPIEFNAASYKTVSAALAELESEMSVLPGKLRVLLVLDPLRDLMPLDGDENEAKTMAVVKRWCRSLIADFGFVSVLVVHHLRKSAAGSTGLEMSGSGAMYGAVDSTVMWKAKKEDQPDDDQSLVWVGEMYGTYKVEPRGDDIFGGRWRWDAEHNVITEGLGRQVAASGRAVPGTAVAGVLEAVRGSGTNGILVATICEQLGISDGNARKQLGRLDEKGEVIKEGGRWYGVGLAPHEQPDVLLPVESTDDEVFVDPIHRLD